MDQQIVATRLFAAGDTVTVNPFQTSGGSLNMTSAWITIARVSS